MLLVWNGNGIARKKIGRVRSRKKAQQERKDRNASHSGEILSRREYLRPAQRMMWSSNAAVGFVKPDGTVDAFEKISCTYAGAPGNVSRFSNIRSIVCTLDGYVGLRENGTCICTNVSRYIASHIWEANRWTDVTELSAGDHHVVGLREDGTCVANSIGVNTGYSDSGQCDVSGWQNITSIACGGSFTIGLKRDGTIVAAGIRPPKWENIAVIAAGNDIYAGLTYDGEVRTSKSDAIDGIKNVENIVQLAVANHTVYALTTDGTVYGGRKKYPSDPDKNIQVTSSAVAITGGSGGLVVLKENGTVERLGEYPGRALMDNFAKIPDRYRLFESYDKLGEQKKPEADRRKSGVCRHCGGEFKKSLFAVKCTKCGVKKDY